MMAINQLKAKEYGTPLLIFSDLRGKPGFRGIKLGFDAIPPTMKYVHSRQQVSQQHTLNIWLYFSPNYQLKPYIFTLD